MFRTIFAKVPRRSIKVSEGSLSTIVKMMKEITDKMFGENPRESNSLARIVNKSDFLRLKNLVTIGQDST